MLDAVPSPRNTPAHRRRRRVTGTDQQFRPSPSRGRRAAEQQRRVGAGPTNTLSAAHRPAVALVDNSRMGRPTARSSPVTPRIIRRAGPTAPPADRPRITEQQRGPDWPAVAPGERPIGRARLRACVAPPRSRPGPPRSCSTCTRVRLNPREHHPPGHPPRRRPTASRYLRGRARAPSGGSVACLVGGVWWVCWPSLLSLLGLLAASAFRVRYLRSHWRCSPP